MLGWLIFTPVGFLLDPVFNQIGMWLLVDTSALAVLWRAIYATTLRAHKKEDFGQMVIAVRDDDAYWLDQLTVVSGPQSAIDSAARYAPYRR